MIPAAGAAPLSLAIPTAEFPPTTGLVTVRAINEAAVIVSVPLLLVPLSVPVTVAVSVED